MPRGQDDLPRRVEQAVEKAYQMDWRLQDLAVHVLPLDRSRRPAEKEGNR